VLRYLVDSFREEGYLHFGGTCVGLVGAVFRNEALLLLLDEHTLSCADLLLSYILGYCSTPLARGAMHRPPR